MLSFNVNLACSQTAAVRCIRTVMLILFNNKWARCFQEAVCMLFSSVQSLSCVRLFVTPWTAACEASLSITNSWSLPKLTSIESVIPSSHLILCHPLLLLPSIFPNIRVFPNESVCIRWPKYWVSTLPFVLPMNIQGWFLLGLTGFISLKSKGLSSITRVFSNTTVQKHQFFGAQLHLWSNSHPHRTTGKTVVLTRQTFIRKVMSLLFNMLSRFVSLSSHYFRIW